MHPTAWDRVADEAQQALTGRFQGRLLGARLLFNTAPRRAGQLATFNYWWLAHAVEVRVDGAERAGGGTTAGRAGGRTTAGRDARVALAENSYAGILCRNRGLLNHYFDDMGWLGLAALRLYDLTGSRRYLDDAGVLWRYILAAGTTDLAGHGIAWRDSQPDYRNAPTNGVFAILSARLAARTGNRHHLHAAEASLAFFTRTFVGVPGGDPDLVIDGVNRTGDGTADVDWIFTYNQGLHVGALVEAFDRTGDPAHLDCATRTALATIRRLAPTGVFTSERAELGERGGGDAGLFKGIFFRYLELLLERPAGSGDGFRMLGDFLIANSDLLVRNARPLAADDWSEEPGPTTALSTQLAAVMTLEARARYERHAATR